MTPQIKYNEDNNLIFIFRISSIFILSVGALLQFEYLEIENYIKFCIFLFLFGSTFNYVLDPPSRTKSLLTLLILYGQIALIILSYFFAEQISSIGSMLGFNVSEAHRVLFEREPFDPLKRSFSIFDNPNIASRLLLITYIFYYCFADKVKKRDIFLTFISIYLTGSRAALFIFLIFTFFNSKKITGDKKTNFQIIWAPIFIIVFTLWTYLGNRIFDFTMLQLSYEYKLGIFQSVIDNSYISGVYDSDLSLITHQFGYAGLIVLVILIASSILGVKKHARFFLIMYAFSGSVIFSTPTLALLLLLRWIKDR